MMLYFLYAIFFLSCIVLVISVLLQPGKLDAGALFTSNISSTAFGPRGATTILAKITIVAAVIFFLSALLLSVPSITGEISVLQTAERTVNQQEDKNKEKKTEESKSDNNEAKKEQSNGDVEQSKEADK
jgi:preprotein translocase subunit SecG